MTHHLIVRALGVAMLAAAGPAEAQQTAAIPGVRNYTRVDATIGCAGSTAVEALPHLRREGFVSVINLREEGEPGADVARAMTEARALGLKYIHIPFNGQAPDPARVDEFLAAIDDQSNLPAFVHCGSANRVAGMWIVKRMLRDGWAEDRALAEAAAIGLTSASLREFALDYVRAHR